MPPDQALIDALKHRGIEWWGGYIGGAGLYLGTPWPHDAWRLLEDNGIEPLPIYVPDQALRGMAAHDAAMEAIDLVDAAGMMDTVCVDAEHVMATVMNYESWLDGFTHEVLAAGWRSVSYAGAPYVPGGSYPWHVHWGSPQLVPPAGQAYQYGPYTILGRQVDADNAADDFPFALFHGTPHVPTQEADLTPEEHNWLEQLNMVLNATDAAKDDAGKPIPDHWAVAYALTHARAADQKADAILATLNKLAAGETADGPGGAALDVAALAAEIVKYLGAKLA
jgi:hypothetical protein